MTSRLSLTWRIRPGAALRFGGTKTERHHLDFVIDGQSLYDIVQAQVNDFVGALGWLPSHDNERTVAQLLLEEPGPLPDGRVPLFICPECGDIGCGAITAIVSIRDNEFEWRDFGYQHNYDPRMADFASYANIGPFRFAATDYRAVIRSTLAMVR